MKKLIWILALVSVACVACTSAKVAPVNVTVTNPLAVDVACQTVELEWSSVAEKIAGLTPDSVVVCDAQGVQVPSQVIFNGTLEPQTLIFQVGLTASASADFGVDKGVREAYPNQAFGRFVPERKDDYAWENNIVAFRTYGPALEAELVTNGIDYWAKSTPELIIDKWYAKDLSGQGSYHLDTGEGSDCYKVGPTLGMGSSAPVVEGKLCYPRNFALWQTLDNGPIRTSVKLTFAPFVVGKDTVNQVKVISLDANMRFNKMVDLYTGKFDSLSVAAGSIVHDSAELFVGADYDALYEPASDSKAGGDGSIGGAVIMADGVSAKIDGSMVRVGVAKVGVPFVYYAGAATSKRDITSGALWNEYTAGVAAEIASPFVVTIK